MMIITERMLLRPFILEDVEDLYEYCKNPNIGNGGGWKPHESIDDTQQILNNFLVDECELAMVYQGKVVGSFGIHPDKRRYIDRAFMIGYCLSEDYWGRGLMTEAAQSAIRYAFEKKYATVVTVYHFPFNERSKRVIEKCGFTYDGTLRHSYQMYTGEIYDELCYSILREEWENWKK